MTKRFDYIDFISKECKTELATADFVSQLMMQKVYEKGFKDACMESNVIPVSVLEDIKAEIAQHLQIMDICSVEKVNGVIVQAESIGQVVRYDSVMQIIDKHMESEDKES